MFHSKHPAALLHATARIVSGGGVYVSDKPGAHDFELLKRMVLPDGSVLRPLLPARPTKDILFADVLKDNKTLLKVIQAVAAPLLLCEIMLPHRQVTQFGLGQARCTTRLTQSCVSADQ